MDPISAREDRLTGQEVFQFKPAGANGGCFTPEENVFFGVPITQVGLKSIPSNCRRSLYVRPPMGPGIFVVMKISSRFTPDSSRIPYASSWKGMKAHFWE